MRVFGIDPGTFMMGVGIVESHDDSGMSLVYSGVLIPRKEAPLFERLHYLYQQLLLVIQEYQPSVMAIEEPFVARNVRAAMAIGQAQAVAMVAAADQGMSVSGYAPREIKRSVTDYGGSSKEQVQEMIRVLLGLPDELVQSSDAADALAVAICHINASRIDRLEISE